MSVMAWLFSRYSVELDIMNGQFLSKHRKIKAFRVFIVPETAALIQRLLNFLTMFDNNDFWTISGCGMIGEKLIL